ncbi:type VI secretion system tip protein VgrG [Massilia sp. P8910]|uniref:type VI secretion system Vgr family protein n=1 Tax=Massilia antarctica TaxID=2765360 RepID=UPI001E6143E8|nr:type VI secretion system Vgr family protein [Massilia antarctica]MCE3605081.1 type VI secretion system tip protein VgrG [Massilia antarctica]
MSNHVAALSGSFTQTTRLLRLTTPLGADTLLAECVRGEETISAGFSFTISALALDASLALSALLGQPALLQLLTVDGASPRPFHGHLTAVELNGANGGMARYTLTLQPWSVFLARGRDSRVFQDMTVFDILDAVFASWQGLGKLAPAWRFEIAERDVYPRRSLTTQYQESDLAFCERLMSEEGLFYFYEHVGDAASDNLGRHEMVIADHNGAFQPNAQARVRFTQPGAVMKEDSLDRWRSECKLQTNLVELMSWNYRALDTRPVSAAAARQGNAELAVRDVPGAYAYVSRVQGQRIADNQMQALDAQREVFTGAGTVRTLAPGTTFALSGHPVHDRAASEDERSFAITRTVHLMHNNLSAELQADVQRQLGGAGLAAAIAEEQAGSLHAVGSAMGQRPLYRNRIDAIPVRVPFRASRSDGHGQLLHPRPSVRGQQSAIVVGPPGSVIHTDRDHRVKVQFHWQRGDASHSRLAHPHPQGHSGAPADDLAGTWVRVASPLAPVAGANWGGNALPRVGQEVLVDFLEGNIDRPVIIGALYNGIGREDAQHNQVARGGGAATGNAASWFPGNSGAHAHAAVLSGLKSQEMQASQSGVSAYSQLVFDDSPQQSRVSLQRHAGAHQGAAELNLGHLRHQTDNQRLAPAGFGAELKTEHSAALRAGRGMLLSTDSTTGEHGHMLESLPAHAEITRARTLQVSLAELAQNHNAMLKDALDAPEPKPEKLPAIVGMENSMAVLESTEEATTLAPSAHGPAGGQGKVTAYSETHMQLSSPAGIVATTPRDAILSSDNSTSIVAVHDINSAIQGNYLHSVKNGISLFTYGKVGSPGKPDQETGIRLHAASGKFSSQSQTGETRLTAERDITVASNTGTVTVAASTHTLMNAAGAFMLFEGGNISLHGPGVITFSAGFIDLTIPASLPLKVPNLPKSQELIDASDKPWFSQQINAQEVLEIDADYEGMPYQIWKKGAKVCLAAGQLNADGLSTRLFTEQGEDISIIIGDASWEVFAPELPVPPAGHGDPDNDE